MLPAVMRIWAAVFGPIPGMDSRIWVWGMPLMTSMTSQIGESMYSFVLAVPAISVWVVTRVERAATNAVGEVWVMLKVFAGRAACARKQAHAQGSTVQTTDLVTPW